MTFAVVSNTNFTGRVAAKGALQNGWIDVTGNRVNINSSGYAVRIVSDTNPGNTSLLLRLVAEVTADAQMVVQFT